MRLYEFDNFDRSSFKLKYGKTVEDKIADIEQEYSTLLNNSKVFALSSRGKDILKSDADSIMKIISNVFEFCNECKDDTETREYLDKLVDLNNKIISIVDPLG